MPETPERLAERLANENQKTLEFFRALSPEQWDCVVYPQGPVWTARHLLAHFVSAEQAIMRLVEDIYAGGTGAPEDFDIDGFNASEVADWVKRPQRELLDNFDRSRQACVALVKKMQPLDLAKSGRHPFLGWVTLEDIIKMLYRHDQIHLRDLRRLLNPDTGARTE
jgi:DinB superfamily